MTTIHNPLKRPSDALHTNYNEVMKVIGDYPVKHTSVFGSTVHDEDIIGLMTPEAAIDLAIKETIMEEALRDKE